MSNGFFIRKLRVTGNQQRPAEIIFKSGLNVVSGASNTGKSYIFQCIDFLLGARKTPKEIDESKNYSTFELEIESYDGRIFSLRRTLTSNKFVIKDGPIDSDSQEEEYADRLSDDPKNISTFLLNLCAFQNVELKKSRSEKVRLSFRDIGGLTLVDEQQVITENSPVYHSNESVAKTKEQSLFYYLLTGKDAKEFKQEEDPKTFKSKVNGKIEFIKELIDKTQVKLEAFKGQNTDDLKKLVDEKLDSLSLEYNTYIHKIDELKKRRNVYQVQKTKKESAVLFKKELLERFELLKKHYLSDLERLQFISEGNHLLSQLNNVTCPICGSELDDEHTKCLIKYEEENISIEQASKFEVEKISLKLTELNGTINNLKDEIEKTSSLIVKLSSHINEADVEITRNLTPVTATLKERINNLFSEKNRLEEYNRLRDQITTYTYQIKDLTDLLKQKNKQNKESVSMSKSSLTKFCSLVENRLNAWKFPGITSLVFDARFEPFDIKINNNNRASNGKGIRAITYSAFIISLMKYCKQENHPHSFNIVIDSPLTTFKERDRKKEDQLSEETENSFFHDLANIGDEFQVIILDNKEPPEDVKDRINYIHFSGENGIDRAGFF